MSWPENSQRTAREQPENSQRTPSCREATVGKHPVRKEPAEGKRKLDPATRETQNTCSSVKFKQGFQIY